MLAEAPNFEIKTGEQVPRGMETWNLRDIILSLSYQFPAQVRRVPSSLDQIQKLLREQVGRQLSSDLVGKLGFDELEWQLVYNPRNLPILFLGASKSQDDPQPINLSEAMGTINIDRIVSAKDSRVVPWKIGVAGVGLASDKSQRVMAVRYSADWKQAIHVDVSISNQEFPDQTRDLLMQDAYYRVARLIPSGHSRVYEIGGVVSQAMCLATAVNPEDAHKRVLSASDSRRVDLQDGLCDVRLLDLGHFPRLYGFTVDSLDRNHRIYFDPPKAGTQGLTAWQVDFPKSLA